MNEKNCAPQKPKHQPTEITKNIKGGYNPPKSQDKRPKPPPKPPKKKS